MNTCVNLFPMLSNAVIGGLGQHPDPMKRKLGYGAVQLYIPEMFMTKNHVSDLIEELSEISKKTADQANYTKHHQINVTSQLWPLFELDHICQAGRAVIKQNGYVECMLSLPFEDLSNYLGAELIQNELMLPYMAIDQQDQSKCMPIWYDDLAKSNDSFVEGNYSDYIQNKSE